MTIRKNLIALMIIIYSAEASFLPYLMLYLSRFYQPAEIGILASIGPLMMILIQPVWGWIADRWTLTRALFIVVTGTILSVIPQLFAHSYLWVLIVLVIYCIFHTPLQNLLDTSALTFNPEQFGSIRLWGSAGFSAVVLLVGALKWYENGNWIYFSHIFLLFLSLPFIWLLTKQKINYKMVPASVSPTNDKTSFTETFKNPTLPLLLILVFLTGITVKGNDTFFTIGLNAMHGNGWVIGSAWCIEALPEVWVFLWADKMVKTMSPWKVIFFGSLFYSIRFAMVCFTHTIWTWLLAQALGSFCFCFWYTGSLQSIKRIVPEKRQVTGQALFWIFGFGFAGIIGGYFSGWIVNKYNISVLYRWIGAVSFFTTLGFYIMARYNSQGHGKKNRFIVSNKETEL